MSRRHLSLFAAVLTSCLAWFLLMAALSHAQVPGAGDACTGDGMLDDILCKYKTASGRWSNLIQRAAEWLFWTLVVISMVWTFSMQALRRGDILEILAELTRFTIFVGFFHYLLTNGTYIGETIINSLRMLASQAGGVTNAIRPSGIIDVGLEIVFHVISRSSILSLLDGIFGFFMAAFILVVLATVAIDMLQLLVAAWFLLYAGVFFLGFGGSKWTSDMAIGYFRTVLSIAVQTFAMILLVGLGKSIIDEVYQSATDQNFLYTLGVLVVVAYTIYRLTSRIPPLLGQLVTGSHASGASASGATLADATMLGSSTVATAAYSMGGSLMAQGVSQAAGMVEAYRAATGVARSELNAGGAGGSSSAGVGPLAAAFGDHLPRGGGGSAGASASSTMGRAATNVGGAQQAPAVEASGDGSAVSSSSESGDAQTPAKPASSSERSVGGEPAGVSATADHAHTTEPQRAGEVRATDDESAAHAPADRVAAAAQGKPEATGPVESPAGVSVGSGDEEESGLEDKTATAPRGALEEDPEQPMAATSSAQSTSAAQSKSAAAASQNKAEGATPGQVKDGSPATGPGPSAGVDAAKASSSPAAPAVGASAATPSTPPAGGHSDSASSSSTSTATTASLAGATPAAGAAPDGTRSPSSSTTAAAAEGVADNSSQTGPVAAEASAPSASQPAGESGATTAVDGGGVHQAEGVVPSGSSRRATSTAAAAPRNDAALRAAIRSRAAEIFVETAKREGRQIASAAIENFQARAASRIANTAGGRMAQSIRQRSGEPPALGEVAAFRDGGGSIGAPAGGAGALKQGPASAQSGSPHQSAGASAGEDEAFDSAGSDSSSATAARGTHQPTGVRDEDGGKSS